MSSSVKQSLTQGTDGKLHDIDNYWRWLFFDALISDELFLESPKEAGLIGIDLEVGKSYDNTYVGSWDESRTMISSNMGLFLCL